MATIDELRDIIFYLARKVNNVITFLREEEQPRRFIEEPANPHPFPSDMTIQERIEYLRRSINGEEQPQLPITMEEEITPPPPPTPEDKKIYKTEEQKIVTQLVEQETVIEYLSKQLEDAQKEKEVLEEKLKCFRYAHDL